MSKTRILLDYIKIIQFFCWFLVCHLFLLEWCYLLHHTNKIIIIIKINEDIIAWCNQTRIFLKQRCYTSSCVHIIITSLSTMHDKQPSIYIYICRVLCVKMENFIKCTSWTKSNFCLIFFYIMHILFHKMNKNLTKFWIIFFILLNVQHTIFF